MADLDDATIDMMLEAARAAKAAGAGDWHVVGDPWGDGSWVISGHSDPHRGRFVADCQPLDEDIDGDQGVLVRAEHIAAASPDRIIALVEEVRRLRAERQAREETKKS